MVVLYVRGARVGTIEQDPQLLARLIESGEPVEFRTDTGRNLGTVVRPTNGTAPACPWEQELTREEVDRRVRESKRSSLDDILKRLGSE
jgi:hypothetical protein